MWAPFSLWSQNIPSPFYAQVRTVGPAGRPVMLEKVISEERVIASATGDTCIEQQLAYFREYGKFLDTVQWSFCYTRNEIRISKNKILRHVLPRNPSAEAVEATLFGKVQKVSIQVMVDSLNPPQRFIVVTATEKQQQQVVVELSAMRLVHETQGIEQRRYLDAPQFSGVMQPGALDSTDYCTATRWKIGDRIQWLIQDKRIDNQGKPEWRNAYLLEHQLVRVSQVDGNPVYVFSHAMTNLFNGTRENRDTLTVMEMPEGLFLATFIGLPYTAMQGKFRIADPKAEDWVYYLFPLEELYDPTVEVVYHDSTEILGKTFKTLHYWNATMPGSFSWIYDFPLPWRDNPIQRYQAVHLILGGEVLGSPYIPAMPEGTVMTQFNENLGKLELEFKRGAKKEKLHFELIDANSMAKMAVEPSETTLKEELQKITLVVKDMLPSQYYTLNVYRVEGKDKQVRIQEFPFMSKKSYQQ